jgi:Glycosyltransferase family 87
MTKHVWPLHTKLPVLAAVLLVLAALFVGAHRHGSVYAAWRMLHIPSTTPLFADTRTVTDSIDCLAKGQDPYITRACDPWHRLYNYPPVWLDARYLGVTSRASNFIGTAMAILSVCALLLLFNARSWISAVIIFLAVISPSFLFAVERGNIDQLIFFLLTIGFFWIEHQRAAAKVYLSGLLIVLLTVLKVYPIVAAALFLRYRNGVMKALLVAMFAIAALFLTSGHHLQTIFANTPQRAEATFGSYPFFLTIVQHTVPSWRPAVESRPIIAKIGAILLGSLAAVAGAIYGKRFERILPRIDFERARGCITVSCLAIFCFVFSAGASFNYRLIFLLGVLAYLVDDINEGVSQRVPLRSLPVAILILLLLWKPFHLFLPHELLDGTVFVIASAWLGNSLLSRRSNCSTAVTPSLASPSRGLHRQVTRV